MWICKRCGSSKIYVQLKLFKEKITEKSSKEKGQFVCSNCGLTASSLEEIAKFIKEIK